MPKELTWKEAISKVLEQSNTPLHYNEITERIIDENLRKKLGATPSATVNAQISASIKHKGDQSPYVRMGKGIFTIKQRTSNTVISPKLTPNVAESDEDEEQYEIITSFGMFWNREGVEWGPMPKLLGVQKIGATPVDFCKQLGIYLLYDGREVIYVGRTTDRPLGKRLYEHTLKRLSTRWNRFSWFGLLPVKPDGSLKPLPETYDAAKLIPAFESILIEALEPRQNRKRGDDLEAVEYFQQIDPEIEKKKIRETLAVALNKL